LDALESEKDCVAGFEFGSAVAQAFGPEGLDATSAAAKRRSLARSLQG
jgi:hypothetical protein